MKSEYSYFAVLTYGSDGISIHFPDLPGCLSCADKDDTVSAIRNAKEALGLHLFGMEQDGELIPEPTEINGLALDKNQAFALINVFMPTVRATVRTSFVKKTVSLPAWLYGPGTCDCFTVTLQQIRLFLYNPFCNGNMGF